MSKGNEEFKTKEEIPFSDFFDDSSPVSKALEKARPVKKDNDSTEEKKPEKEAEEEKLYSPSDLENFWISILNQEPYRTEGSLKGLKYVIQTLTDAQRKQIDSYMDASKFKLTVHYEAQEARCILASMFKKFGKFEVNDDDSIAQRLLKLEKVSIPVLDIMLKIMRKFNAKIEQMMEEINSENF